MLPRGHAIVSGIIGITTGFYFRSAACGFASFIAGVSIDLDHLLDYWLSHKLTIDLREIYVTCAETKLKKLYLLLHSYEFIAALWVLIYLFSLSNIWKAVAIGFTQHIIADQITNPISTFGYFLTYRIHHGFARNKILKNR